MYVYIYLWVCVCANIYAPLAGDDLYYSSSFLQLSFTLKEMSEWKRKTSVHLIRIHDDKKEERKETWFTYSIGGATAIMCLSHTLIIILLLLPGVFFSIDERKASSKHSMNRNWMRARIHNIRCVELCQILFRMMTFHFSLPLSLTFFFPSSWNFNQTASPECREEKEEKETKIKMTKEKEEWMLKECLWSVRQRLSRIGISTNHKQGSISSFVIDFLLLLLLSSILEGEKTRRAFVLSLLVTHINEDSN